VMMWKHFGIFVFCGLLSLCQGVLSGLSCDVSPRAMQSVLTDAIIEKGVLQRHLQGMVVPNIMGNGGLLNSPTSITGLHLVKTGAPKLWVTVLPGMGVHVAITTKLELRGNCLLGLVSDLLDILVDVTITANIKCTNFESGTAQVITEDCLCILGAIKVKLLSGLLSISVNDLVLSQLKVTLPSLLCRVIDIVMNLVSIQLLGTLNAVVAVGTSGTIHYHMASIPVAADWSLRIDLNGEVKKVGGSIIPHDSSASALPADRMDKLMVLALPESFLNSAVNLMVDIAPQTFRCTPQVFSGATRLQEAITALTPSGCSSCRGNSPLSIKLTLAGNPLILLEDKKATLSLSVLIQIFTPGLDGSVLNVLLLKADLALNVRVSITAGRLVLSLSLG
ncbi:BPIB4 protein, partial [Turnix velox]|nr:BPIB4 protein [Turnix velox]